MIVVKYPILKREIVVVVVIPVTITMETKNKLLDVHVKESTVMLVVIFTEHSLILMNN